MENFVNIEKFKENLITEIDSITEEKRMLYDQAKKLEVKIINL
jgi:hypothetical protein